MLLKLSVRPAGSELQIVGAAWQFYIITATCRYCIVFMMCVCVCVSVNKTRQVLAQTRHNLESHHNAAGKHDGSQK